MRIINCKRSKNIKNLQSILNVRRDGRNIDTSIVPHILKNIKSTKNIAVRKYERKFNNNVKIKPSVIEIKKSIKKLDPKIKKAIDFAIHKPATVAVEEFKNLLLNNLKN